MEMDFIGSAIWWWNKFTFNVLPLSSSLALKFIKWHDAPGEICVYVHMTGFKFLFFVFVIKQRSVYSINLIRSAAVHGA